MAVAFSTVSQPGLLGQQYPPPLLPKPGKDNVRLQKLLKRTAKKKTSAQASQSTAPFRSSLSPVNEASPDLEHSDHSTPPQTPEWSFSLYSVRQPPRYTIRPLYQHVASPYPQRAAYGRGARLSPQTVAMPSYPYSQHVTTLSSYSASTHLSEVLVAQGPVAQPVVPKISLPASPVPDMTVPSAVKNPGPTAYPTAGGRTVTRPLTVLAPLVKPKNTQTKTRDMNTIIIHTPEIKRKTPTPEIKSSTPTSEIKRATPTSEIKRATPTPEIKRRATPTPEIKRAAPISEIKRRATPTPEIKRATPTSEIKRATPTPEIKRATPTYELQTSRTLVGRPKTPAFHVTRATTPVFEISKPNPLLFAVSPITVEPQRSKTKPETILNEDIQSDLTPTAKPIQQSMTKAKSEPDLTREKLQVAAAGSQRPKTPTLEPATQLVTSHGFQRSMTPTYEATRLMTTSPGYKRPKTPSGVSPVAFQRPKTPTQAASKSKHLNDICGSVVENSDRTLYLTNALC
uniref:Proline rich 33 n=1 Tax=Anabas testudineus TaxID=64144 RepID=A0AAQ6IUE8_ANATE